MKGGLRSIVRVGLAMAIVAAIAAQMQNLADSGLLRVGNFFSFFTIASNILAVFVLLGLEEAATSPLGRFGRWARGATTLYMTMTGIIYALLLAPIAADVSTQLGWVNVVLHVVAPIGLILDWVMEPDPTPSLTTAAWWLAFPAVWVAYSFIRGAIIDWYPYPFLDPRPDTPFGAGSWASALVTVTGLTVAVAVLAVAVRWVASVRANAGPATPT